MKRLRGCLTVAFIFGCGFLVGGFLGAALGWVSFFHKIAKGGPGTVREIVMERTSNDLKLNPGQKVRVRKIVDETSVELTDAMTDVRPKIEEILGRSETRLREVLDEKQRKKFDRFVNEGRRRWKASVEARTPPATPSTPPPQSIPPPPATPSPAPAD